MYKIGKTRKDVKKLLKKKKVEAVAERSKYTRKRNMSSRKSYVRINKL